MDEEHLNLLTEEPKRRFLFRRRRIAGIILLTLAVGVVLSFVSKDASDSSSGHPSVFSTVRKIVGSADKELSGEDDDRINFLLLGIGGAGHDGPELTDTIIFASIRPSTRDVGLLSIPRDLSVPIEGYGWRKINHVNAYGEEAKYGSGPELAAETVSEILDQPIHYWVKVDFKGFEEFIDAIGGLDIDVERAFADPAFPIDDGLGTTIALAFEEGRQHMDGETALRFVRSRHGNNNEGSDFARAARQQKVLLAAKQKILSPGTLLNPARIAKMIDTLNDNIHTNLTTWEMLRLGNLSDLFDGDNLHSVVLTTAPGSPLYETYVNDAYVILPRNNDWTPLQQLAEDIFTAESELVALPPAAPRDIRIEIQNATGIPGLASQTADLLRLQGYDVVAVGNAATENIERTTIYDLSNGTHRTELIALQDYLSADLSLSAPGWLLTQEVIPEELTVTNDAARGASTVEGVDVLIVLGESSRNLVR